MVAPLPTGIICERPQTMTRAKGEVGNMLAAESR